LVWRPESGAFPAGPKEVDAVGALVLTDAERTFLLEARRLVLCTVAPDGTPRPVPVCFALLEDGGGGGGGPRLYTPLDAKPKRVADPRLLARVRDIADRPEVTLLVDRWDEDWDLLGWLRLHGIASLLEPAGEGSAAGEPAAEHAAAVSALLNRYPQYASHNLPTRPIIRVVLIRAVSWGVA
jgi:coenzyme F420-0:L-glutamate ligase / coenzyme F420-1:gamma-L-glutamate ligase